MTRKPMFYVIWFILVFMIVATVSYLRFASKAEAAGGVITTVNSQGVAGAPLSVTQCPTTAKLLAGNNTRTSWTILPEGGDIRCQVGTSGDAAGTPVPTASVGFLFKSNVYMPETTLNIGSSVATLRLDCCGVSGAVSTDTFEE